MTAVANPPVRVRIAPSPTGDPHVGTAYMALFNTAFARKNGGSFIIRIEDTDQKRSNPASEAAILSSLKWLGFSWDEGPDVGGNYGPYRQSERLDIYQKHVQKLLDSGHAYWCTCSAERLDEVRKRQLALKQRPGYDRHCRDKGFEKSPAAVVRLKTPLTGKTEVNDALRGMVTFDNTEVDDQVLLKSDGFPTYHLASVVDDRLMEISHVIRGEEWISSTPKHVLLYQFFGWQAPVFCHLPLLRNADKTKVSKRKNPVSLSYFKEAGYLPDAMLNFLGLMAFSLADGQEMFTLDEFIAQFELGRISLGGPVFDLKKLLWLNGRYLREKRSDAQIVSYLQDQLFSTHYLSQVVNLVKERVEKSEDFIGYADFFFAAEVHPDLKSLILKGRDLKETLKILNLLVEKIDEQINFDASSLEAAMREFCEKNEIKTGDLFMPIRLIVTGKKASPPLFDTMSVLGKERCRTRMRKAIENLKAYKE